MELHLYEEQVVALDKSLTCAHKDRAEIYLSTNVLFSSPELVT